MLAVPILLGIGCAVMHWITARSTNADARLLAYAVTAIWGIANVAWYLDALWLLPVLDLLFGSAVIAIWRRDSENWTTLLIQVILARLVLHVLDSAFGHAALVPYIHGLNLLFTIEILTISYAGGRAGGLPMFLRLRRLRVSLRSPQKTEEVR